MENSTKATPLVQMRGITKDFPGVRAVDRVDFDADSGRVHALVGENGAGKSTLAKILCGALAASAGHMLMNGAEIAVPTPQAAQKAGISMIYQEFNLIPDLSVSENIFLGRFPTKGPGVADFAKMHADSAALLATVGAKFSPGAQVRRLSVAEQQLVEIAKALSLDARVIIMDEPTAALTEREIESLFEVIRSLKSRGVAVIYISHRLEEVFEIADEITVMRDGEIVSSGPIGEYTPEKVVSAMVGRELQAANGTRSKPGEPALSVRGLTTEDGRVKDVSFDLHKGEILGVYGLVGAGRTETARAVFGLQPVRSGEVLLRGKPVRFRSSAEAVKAGVGLLPEDRKTQGLVLSMAVRENMTLSSIRRFTRFGFVARKAEAAEARRLKDALNVRLASLEQPTSSLSGGNQQKVVLAKVLSSQADVLMFDEPTRGIDVGAKAEIHALMRDLVDGRGAAVLMISSDLPEILTTSDRVLVMREGAMVAQFDRADATEERVLEAALGGVT
jgi:ribose transport system ATP-binding protein